MVILFYIYRKYVNYNYVILLFEKNFKKPLKFKYLYLFNIIIQILYLNNSYAQEKVDIKGFETDLFSRFVFDWQKPVEYQAEIQGKELTIRFERSQFFEIEKLKFLPKKL